MEEASFSPTDERFGRYTDKITYPGSHARIVKRTVERNEDRERLE